MDRRPNTLHLTNAEFGWRSTLPKTERTLMNPMIVTAEVSATAVVITQEDPRHPDYNPEDKEENK